MTTWTAYAAGALVLDADLVPCEDSVDPAQGEAVAVLLFGFEVQGSTSSPNPKTPKPQNSKAPNPQSPQTPKAPKPQSPKNPVSKGKEAKNR